MPAMLRGVLTLLALLRKRRQLDGWSGIALTPSEGIGLARITRTEADDTPHLHYCEYHPLEGASEGQLLARVADQHRLAQISCCSVLSAGDANLLLVNTPEVERSELRAAVRWQVKDMLSYHIDDAVIDVFDIPGESERGRQNMMYVVSARTSRMRQHIDQLESHGINLSAIDIPELAQRNVAELLPEDEGGVALLRFSRRQGLLTLTRQSSLYLARNLDSGIEQMEQALQAADMNDGNELGLTLPEEQDGPPAALRSLLDNVILEVQRSLDYYESHFALPPIRTLVVAPLASPIPGLMGYLAGNLGLPVRMLDLNDLLMSDAVLPESLQAEAFLAIAAALRKEEKAL